MNVKTLLPARWKKLLKRLWRLNADVPDFLLQTGEENKIGSLQKDESLFLHGLIKVLRPQVVVEFGFLEGHSSSVMLSAMDGDARLYAYDTSAYAQAAAAVFAKNHPNFFFLSKSQDDFERADVENKRIDFVLVDASHNLEINIAGFQKLKPSLSEEALVMVHDTGLWQKKFMQPEHFETLKKTAGKWLDEERAAHQVDERKFINWLLSHEKEFAVLNFGSTSVLRHGFSLIGKRRALEV